MNTLDKFGRFLIVCEGPPTLLKIDHFFLPTGNPAIFIPFLAIVALWQYEGAQCIVGIRIKSRRAGLKVINSIHNKQQTLVKNATVIIRKQEQ